MKRLLIALLTAVSVSSCVAYGYPYYDNQSYYYPSSSYYPYSYYRSGYCD